MVKSGIFRAAYIETHLIACLFYLWPFSNLKLLILQNLSQINIFSIKQQKKAIFLPLHQNYFINALQKFVQYINFKMESAANIQIIKEEKTSQVKQQNSHSILSLFRFAEDMDYVFMILGAISSLGAGCIFPIMIIFLTDFNEAFASQDTDFRKSLGLSTFLKFIYLGIGALFCGWGSATFWLITGERQTSKCRKDYFQSLLKQDISYYDCNQQSQLYTRFSIDTLNFQGAIGQKLSIVIQVIGSFICTLVISFIQGWLMTLVIIAAIPLPVFSIYMYMSMSEDKNSFILNAYSAAGGKAEEAFASIKTVKQFNAEPFHANQYISQTKSASESKLRTIIKVSLSLGLLNGSIFLIYSLGFWFGANCVMGTSHCPTSITGKLYTAQRVEIIFFTLVMSCFALSSFTPALKKISHGIQAAERIFRMIGQIPKISAQFSGIEPQIFYGKVEFRNITFSYPTDKQRKVLKNFSVVFDLTNTAVVGESGCGKSTIAQLLMRFYDPEAGEILIDDRPIREYNVKWLRSKIGFVGQEPILFAATIKENLLYANPEATPSDIIKALREAQAYDFIFHSLQDKLETFVGTGGSQISGGQKQRIAIAMAIIKNPKILILDEATSALDKVNESLIKKTLDKISKNCTTITIAHNIETIKNVERIIVMNAGTVQQSGRFQQLQFYDNEMLKLSLNRTQSSSPQLIRLTLARQQSMLQEIAFIKRMESEEQRRIEMLKDMQLASSYEDGMRTRILSYCNTKRGALVVGIILSLLLGLFYIVFSLYVGKVITSIFYLQFNQEDQTYKDQINNSCIYFLLIGIGVFLVYFTQNLLGSLVGDQISQGLREQTFIKILKMPVSWFDLCQNSSGSLSHHLNHSCEIINQLVTTQLFIMVQTLSTILGSFILSFYFQWRISLVACVIFPLLMTFGKLRQNFKADLTKQGEQKHMKTGGRICESLIYIRTVYALNMQNHLIERYQQSLQKLYKQVLKAGFYSGLMNGLGMMSTSILSGVLFYVGLNFMIYYGVPFEDLITAIFVCTFSGFSVENNLNFMPDVAKVKISTANIFKILDSEDEEQMQARQQSKMLTEGLDGNINFQHIVFKYDHMQNYALKNISFNIKGGQKFAFVGPSGCGKSTIIQMLLRFYQPLAGTITINGINIKDFDIKYLRSQFGVVGQEPTVFNGTFRSNILYNTLEASEEDIIEAARKANALAFIQGKEKLEGETDNRQVVSGFDWDIGVKGINISGGQKQRLAIARALLRRPKILLLDEATSALDRENEGIVQESLNQIMKGRTTITIAHHINTIQNSDVIILLDEGGIVEQGTYKELLNMKGAFYQLKKGRKKK